MSTFQLIDERCQLNPGMTKFISESGLSVLNRDYNIVSVIGSQNSGKSTMLNRVFGTTFETLQGPNKVQTTKGIFVSRDKSANLVVLDVEGSNSRQRGKNERGAEFYERSTALFALAFSQVLIVNCNSMNLGHESEYSIIKTIMEMNVRLFKSDQVKQLLIVIRDFNDQIENFTEICDSIKAEIYGIWAEVIKPAEFQNVPPEALFKIDFFKASHFVYQRQKFEADMADLRDRFVNPSNPKNMFQGYNYNTNIPIDGLDELSSQIWETIQKNEDLNLPNSKLQASQVRCLKIKDQSLELVNKSFQQMRAAVEKSFQSDFVEQAQAQFAKALQFYDAESQYYIESIRIQMRNVLRDEIKAILFPIFTKQMSTLQDTVKASLKESLTDLNEAFGTFGEFLAELQVLKQEIYIQIEDGIKQSLPFPEYSDEWEVTKTQQSLERSVGELIVNAQNLRFNKFVKGQENQLKRQTDTLLSNLFDELNKDFWVDLRKGFEEIKTVNESMMRQQIVDYFSPERVNQEINRLIMASYIYLEEDVTKKIKELPYFLLKKFKSNFLKDGNNMTRKWKEIEEKDIQELFDSARKNVEEVIYLFQKIYIFDQNNKGSIENDRIAQLRGSLDEPILLTVSQQTKIRNSFHEESEEELNKVMQKRNTSFTGQVPKWMWFVLAFFMYDDVLRWMANPLLLYPILLLVTFIGISFASGYSALPKKIFSDLLMQAGSVVAPLLLKLKP